MSKIVVSVRKTIQETQYEPVAIEVSTELDLGATTDLKFIQKKQLEIAEEIQDTLEEIIVRRAMERDH
jgi:hypothetical protein